MFMINNDAHVEFTSRFPPRSMVDGRSHSLLALRYFHCVVKVCCVMASTLYIVRGIGYVKVRST